MIKYKCSYTHILHRTLAIRNRGYTNKVRLRGLMQNKGFQPAQAVSELVEVRVLPV